MFLRRFLSGKTGRHSANIFPNSRLKPVSVQFHCNSQLGSPSKGHELIHISELFNLLELVSTHWTDLTP